jgi:hypothetical protein
MELYVPRGVADSLGSTECFDLDPAVNQAPVLHKTTGDNSPTGASPELKCPAASRPGEVANCG